MRDMKVISVEKLGKTALERAWRVTAETTFWLPGKKLETHVWVTDGWKQFWYNEMNRRAKWNEAAKLLEATRAFEIQETISGAA